MVSELPVVGSSGTTYRIQTWGIITPCNDEGATEEELKGILGFKAIVIISDSIVYRTGQHETEEAAWQDAFDWSKTQDKKKSKK